MSFHWLGPQDQKHLCRHISKAISIRMVYHINMSRREISVLQQADAHPGPDCRKRYRHDVLPGRGYRYVFLKKAEATGISL